MEIDILRIVVEMLGECNPSMISYRPIDKLFTYGLKFTLRTLAENFIDFEFYGNEGSEITIKTYIENGTGWCPGRKNNKFQLADPKSFEELSEFILEACYNSHVIIEFQSVDNLDFEIAYEEDDLS